MTTSEQALLDAASIYGEARNYGPAAAHAQAVKDVAVAFAAEAIAEQIAAWLEQHAYDDEFAVGHREVGVHRLAAAIRAGRWKL